ncbi:MAG: hypothetical protein QXJ27_06745 [Thermoplasmata archaeon]
MRKNETLKGLVFLYFIAAIVRSLLRQRMIEAKLRTVQIGNIWKLTEITKKQRDTEEDECSCAISVEHSY